MKKTRDRNKKMNYGFQYMDTIEDKYGDEYQVLYLPTKMGSRDKSLPTEHQIGKLNNLNAKLQTMAILGMEGNVIKSTAMMAGGMLSKNDGYEAVMFTGANKMYPVSFNELQIYEYGKPAFKIIKKFGFDEYLDSLDVTNVKDTDLRLSNIAESLSYTDSTVEGINKFIDGIYTLFRADDADLKKVINSVYVSKEHKLVQLLKTKKCNRIDYPTSTMVAIENYKFSDDIFDIVEYMLRNKSVIGLIRLVLLSNYYNKNNIPMYSKFEIKQDNNKIRTIHAPNDEIKKASREVNYRLNSGYEHIMESNTTVSESVFGYRKGKNIQMNAAYHRQNKKILKFDIQSFFDNCDWSYFSNSINFLITPMKRTGNMYTTAEYALINKLYDLIKSVIINPETGGLYMGNPLSGTLSNLLMIRIVRHINNIVSNEDIKFSIYADDMTFSSRETNPYLNKKYLNFIIEHVFEQAGYDFQIKEEKTIFMRNQKRRITGVRINHNNDVTWDRSIYRKLRMTFKLLSDGVPIDELEFSKNKLAGITGFFLYTDKSGKMFRLVDKYRDVLLEHNIVSEKVLDREVVTNG